MYQDIGILKVLFQLEKRFVKQLRKSRVRVRICENGEIFRVSQKTGKIKGFKLQIVTVFC